MNPAQRPLNLDFLPRYGSSPLGLALLVLGATLAVLTLAALANTLRGLEEQRHFLSRHRAAQTALPTPQTDAQRRKAASNRREAWKAAREVIERLGVPWTDLLGELAAATTTDVALIALTPDPQKRLIRISAEARDLPAMLRYTARLAGGGSLDNVALLNHEVIESDADRPVRFNLTAHWRATAHAAE